MKKRRPVSYIFILIALILGLLLMHYLTRVYFVGLIIFFIVIAFQTPSTHVDKTGEANDANMAMLKYIGLSTLAYLIGGYAAILLF